MAIQQHIYLAADNIVIAANKYILLIQRKNPPFRDMWAFPGGFIEDDEDLSQAAVRELKEETGLTITASEVELIDTVGTIGRDPRFRTVSVVFYAKVESKKEIKGGDDAAKAQWFNLDQLPELGFDHQDILDRFLGRVEME